MQSTGKNTFFGKTATMLQSADGLGHLQRILMSIVVALVVISLVLCVTMLIYLMVYGKESLKEALTFVVVVLVVSIPIAIEIVCTTTLAIGSRQVCVCGGVCARGGGLVGWCEGEGGGTEADAHVFVGLGGRVSLRAAQQQGTACDMHTTRRNVAPNRRCCCPLLSCSCPPTERLSPAWRPLRRWLA